MTPVCLVRRALPLRLSILVLTMGTAHASSVSVSSSRAYMEPNANRAGDKDGCPPTASSADPEEGTLQVTIVATSTIASPMLLVSDDNAPTGAWTTDTRDDFTLDEFSATDGAAVTSGTRDIDYLDGILDGSLAAGTYYTYFNLDKTGYNQTALSNCAGNSITGDHEAYTATLQAGSTSVASGSLTTVMEATTSISQNDLDWLETYPLSTEADVGEAFCIRTKYRQSSANSVGYLIAHTYYNADNIRLDSVDLYFYDTNGVDPGTVATGIPGVTASGTAPVSTFNDVVYFTSAELPTSASSGDYLVGDYCFTVTDTGGSRFIPYFMTQQSGVTGTWKTDSGYNGFQSEPPEPINPPVLSIAKECDATYAELVSGQTTTVTESLLVCNDGLGDAASVIAVDSLPIDPNVVFVSADSGGTYDAASDTISWSIGTLAAGVCEEVSFTLDVTPSVGDTGIDTNAGATVDGAALVDATFLVSADTTETCPFVVVDYTPSISLDKTATSYTDNDGDGTLSPGDDVYYALVVTNNGNTDLTGVAVTDDPDETYVAGIAGSGTYDGDLLTWSVGSLAVGASTTLTYTATLQGAGAFADGTTMVSNTAGVTSSEGASDSDTETVSVAASVALDLEKSAVSYMDNDGNGVLSPGDTVHYVLSYANTGNAAATLTTLSDDPDETWVASISGGGGYDGDLLTWSLGTLAPGATGTVSYDAVLASAGTFPDGATPVVNDASLESAEAGPVLSTATVDVFASVELVVSKSATSIVDNDGDGRLSPGDGVGYSVTYTNTGNADASGATLTDDPDESAVASVAGISGLGVYDGNRITWALGTLTAGATGTVTYVATLDDTFVHGATSVGNTVALDSAEFGPVSDSESVTVSAAASLSVSKTATGYTDADGDGQLSPGDIVTYVVSYANAGNADATGVSLVDDPDETYVVSITNADGTWDGDTLSWTIGTVAPGASGSVTYEATLADAGAFADGNTSVDNVARLSSNELAPVTDTESVTVSAAVVLTVTKAASGYADADGDGALSPGDEVAYTVTYENTGNATANNVALSDDIDELYVDGVGAIDGGGVYDGDRIAWTLGSVTPGETGTVTYVATLGGAGAFSHGATDVGNTATLESDEFGPVSDTAVVTVQASVALVVSKTATGSTDVDGDGALSPGDVVHYTVSYANTGNAHASGVTLSDDPDETYAASVGAISGGGAYDGDTIRWTVGELAAGSSATATYSVTLGGAGAFAHGSTGVSNTVALDSGETGPVTDSETVTVAAAAVVTVSKSITGYTDSDGNGVLSPGDSVSYAVTYANTGNAAATGVTVSDDPDETWVSTVSAGTGSYDGDRLVWDIGTVDPGASGTLSYTVTLANAGTFAHGSTPVANTVVVSSGETSPVEDGETVTVSAAVALTLSKTSTGYDDNDGNGVLSPGDSVSYTVTYANTGDADASGVTLSDDPDESYVAAITDVTGGGAHDGDLVTWNIGTLAAGASASVTYTAVLGDAGTFADGATDVGNTVVLDSAELDPVSASETVTVEATTALAVSKSASGYTDVDNDGALSPGDVVQYAVSYANTGDADASAVTLSDDPDETYVSAVGSISGGGAYDSDQIVWDIGTLAAGASGTVTYSATLGGSGTFAHGSTGVGNIVSLDSGETDPVTDSETVTVTASADVTVAKSSTGYTDADGDGVLSPGDSVTYAVAYGNAGNADATGVVVTDDPDERYVASIDAGTGSYDGDRIAWNIGAVAPGTSATLTYTVTLGGAGTFGDGSTSVGNSVVVESGETPPATDEETVTVQAAIALTLAKVSTGYTDADGDGALSPGDSVAYAVTYANTGNADASAVTLTDDPDEARVASIADVTGGGSYDGDTLSWALGSLAAGASETVTYTAVLGGPGTFADGSTDVDNTAVLDSAESGPISASATVTVTADASLTVAKSSTGYTDTDGDGALSPGDSVTYAVTYANVGNADSTGVIVTDDPDEAYVSTLAAGVGSYDGDRIVWDIGTVAPGASGTLTYTLTLAGAGTFGHGSTTVGNTVVVASDENPPVEDDEDVTVEAAVVLTLSKVSTGYTDADGDGVLSPGDSVSYAVTYANTGNADASGVTLSDDPDEAWVSTITGISGGGTYDGSLLAWDIGSLAAGASATVTYTAVLADAGTFADGSTNVDNTAVLDSAQTDAVTDSETVTVEADTTLTVSKSSTGYTDADGDGVLSPGDSVGYAVTYANTGNATATGVVVSDDPDEAYVSSVGAGTGSYDGDTLVWTIGDVEPGASATLTYTVTLSGVGTFADGSTAVDNSVVASSGETSPVTDQATVTVEASAVLAVSKLNTGYTDADGDGVLSPGDSVAYAVTYANTGNATATSVTLTDDPDEVYVAGITDLGSGTYDGSVILWDVGSLAAGASATVTYTAVLGDAGTFADGSTVVDNTAVLDSAETSPVSDTESVVVTAAVELAMAKSATGYLDTDGDGVLSPGDSVTYAVTWANTGNADASGVSVTDDPDEAYVSAITDVTGGGAYDGDTLTWNVVDLAAGDSATVTYTAVLGGPGTFADGATDVVNTVVMDSEQAGPVSDTATVPVEAGVSLAVAKSSTGYVDVDGDGMLSPGDTVGYEVTYTNTGNADASGVLLTDDPDEAWVSGVADITGGGAYDGDTLTWSVGTLAAGASATVSYTVTLADAGVFPSGTTSVANVAVFSSTEFGPVADTETVDVTAAPELVPTKSLAATEAIEATFSNQMTVSSAETAATASGTVSTTVTISTRLSWTLSVSNIGTATATGITLEDLLPSGTTFESATGSYTLAGGLVSWDVADLEPGAIETVTVTVVTD